jgi:putative membrane protein
MNRGFVNLLLRCLVVALGVVLSAKLVPGISYDSGSTLVVVALVLSLFNAVLRPVLVLFTLPLIFLTLGVGLWFINALLFYFTGRIVAGFHVAGFGPALFGALIVSVTNLVMSRLLTPPRPPAPPSAGGKDEDVIDI